MAAKLWNIPDTLREKLAQAVFPCRRSSRAIKENNLTAELLRPAKGSALQGDTAFCEGYTAVSPVPTLLITTGVWIAWLLRKGFRNTLAYAQAAAVVGPLATSQRTVQGRALA
ncbi:MAG: hypothetical protein ACLUNO_13250 [Oscillospiraceae bacterium]